MTIKLSYQMICGRDGFLRNRVSIAQEIGLAYPVIKRTDEIIAIAM